MGLQGSEVKSSSIYLSVILSCSETDVSNRGELPAVWPTSSPGERKELGQDVGSCDQGWAAGAIFAEQRAGKS